MEKRFEDFTKKQLDTICRVSHNYASYMMANSTFQCSYCYYCPLYFNKEVRIQKGDVGCVISSERVCLKEIVKIISDEDSLKKIDEIEIEVNDEVFDENALGVIHP